MANSRGPSKLSAGKTKQGVVDFSLELIAQRTIYNRRTGQNDFHMVAKCKVGEACCAQWELQLYTDPCAGNSLKILLSLLSCDIEKIRVDFSLHVGSRWSQKYSADFYVGSCFGTSLYAGEGELIQCKGKYYYCEEAVDGTNSLASNLEFLFEEHLHSDVTLMCGKERLPAHKAILSARSPVFRAMFEHQYQESKSGNVVIEDVEYEVLKEMLRFMYTGKQPEMTTKMAERLLIAADKYVLDGLKTMCGRHMAFNLTVGNVVRILILADTHSADNLKTAAQKFIRRHKADVMNTKEWTDMFCSHPLLAVETVKCSVWNEKESD